MFNPLSTVTQFLGLGNMSDVLTTPIIIIGAIIAVIIVIIIVVAVFASGEGMDKAYL